MSAALIGSALDADGAWHCRGVIPPEALPKLRAHADEILKGSSGIRVFADAAISALLATTGVIGRVVVDVLGPHARPVRAILFDKNEAMNWAVPWHQDRTIAVREQREAAGFGPWSVKAGVTHVEPPFELLAGMLTVRAHLDDCDRDNAPLIIVPGSHRLGRIPAATAAELARRSDQISCLAQAGDLWVYSTAILHASERARTPRRRRVLQIDYSAATLPGELEWIGIAA
jgi:ectoine hydroxylase-related dioxygenase (phytanoyl-CoA dioxygenase family)